MADYTPKSFKLDTALVAELEAIAQREDRSQTAIVERALRAYFAASKAETLPAPVSTAASAVVEA